MQVFNSLENLPEFESTIMTQGIFDGVHIGHQKLLEKISQKAKQKNFKSLILTFWPHPRLVLNQNEDLKLLQTIDEKLALFKQIGIDYVVLIEFNKIISELSAEEYIKSILINALNMKEIFIGYDHRFGKNRSGDINTLKKFASQFEFQINEISAIELNDFAISSTKIRNALIQGDIETANSYLNRPYQFSGKVVVGKKIGKTLGFPTANIEINENFKLIPKNGVYIVKVKLNNILYNGMMNIGENPTFLDKSFSIEINLLNFAAEIYGEVLTIYVYQKIRDEVKFENIESLKNQLQNDQLMVEKYFNRH